MPASPTRPEFLTASDLAAAFRVTGSTIRRWSDEGLIPAPQRLPSGRRRWPVASVADMVATYGASIPPRGGDDEPPTAG